MNEQEQKRKKRIQNLVMGLGSFAIVAFLIMTLAIVANNLGAPMPWRTQQIVPPIPNEDEAMEDGAMLENQIRAIVREEYETYKAQTQSTLMVAGFFIMMLAVLPPLVSYFTQKERMDKIDHKLMDAEDKNQKINEGLDRISKELRGKIDKTSFLDNKKFPESEDANDNGIGGTDLPCKKRKNQREKARHLFDKGNKMYDDERFEAAIGYFKEAEKIYDCGAHCKKGCKDVRAAIYSNLARAYRWNHEYLKSLETIKEAYALNLTSEQGRFLYVQGVVYREMQCFLDSLNKLTEAINWEEKREEKIGGPRKNRLALYHNARATTLYEMKAFKDAVEDFDKAIKFASESNEKASYHERRAVIYKELAKVVKNQNPIQATEYEDCAKADETEAEKLRESEK